MTPVVASKKLIKFDPKTFLSTINGGRKIEAFPKKQTIFAQGDSSDAVFYIKEGKVKLTVVSKIGKEATIGILNEGDFFGEGCLTGQPLRLCSATAMTDCSVMRIDKKSMIEVLHREHAFSDMFVAYLLTRNIRYEEDLVDQLFNSSEKRLARILLLLAHFGKEGKPETVIPKMSQETLAEMIGTTRSRVSFFMNRFRKLGFIDYHGGERLASSQFTSQHRSPRLELRSERNGTLLFCRRSDSALTESPACYEIVLRLVFCYQSAIAMRIGARLASAKFTLLPRSGSTSRTANSEYLFWAEFFCHTNLHVQKVVN